MAAESKYLIHTDVKFNPLELIDVRALHEACQEKWYNQTLSRVNDCLIRLGVVQGEFHWHKHDDQDEFFLVLEGQLRIDIEDSKPVVLGPQQGYTVPKGVVHKTSAPSGP